MVRSSQAGEGRAEAHKWFHVVFFSKGIVYVFSQNIEAVYAKRGAVVSCFQSFRLKEKYWCAIHLENPIGLFVVPLYSE